MHYLYVSFFLALITVPSLAQRITNVQAQMIGDYVSVKYDLEGELPGQVFEVELYSSLNEYQQPLKYVRGEIGPNVQPGKQKTIEWGAQKELTAFSGEMSFEVRAKLTYSPIAIQNPQLASVFRRGHAYDLQWKGGIAGEPIRLELIRDGFDNEVIDNIANTGRYTWRIADETPTGENYRIKISGLTNNVPVTQSSDLFAIKRRIPVIVKFIPAGILLGAAAVWVIKQVGPQEEGPLLPPPPQEEL